MLTTTTLNNDSAKETKEESNKKKAQREGKRRQHNVRTNGGTIMRGEGGLLKFKRRTFLPLHLNRWVHQQ